MRAGMKFLNAINVRPREIYPQINYTYEENAMSNGMVRKWIRMFNEGRGNVHDEERGGRPSLITEVLVSCIDEQVHREKRRYQEIPLRSQEISISQRNFSRNLKKFLFR